MMISGPGICGMHSESH